MADVLLTHTNYVYADCKQTAKMQPYPPLQTMIAAAVLEQAGFRVALYDPALDDSEEGFLEALDRHRPVRIVVCEDDFNFLSKMCLARNRETAFRMVRAARMRGIETAVHSSDASDRPEAYLEAGFQAVIVGEPEATILELVQGRPVNSIAGLVFRCESGVHRNVLRPLRTNLDSLPAPAWHLVEIGRYRDAWTAAHGKFSLNMVTSRGCPYRCNWCAKPIYGNNYHARSPEAVAAEMLCLKRTYRPDHIWFADDIFALSPRWTEKFAAAVQRFGAELPFKMQSRCDLMTRDTVRALRSAGCQEVWMGAESGAQHILDAMEKDIQVEDIHAARENLRRHGIRACLFLQFGYPGEKWNDIEATIRMVRQVQPDDIGVSVSYPLPGTKFHRIVSSEMGAKANWTDSSDLAMMFRGEFSTEFYRALSQALHKEMDSGPDVQQAWQRVHRLRAPKNIQLAVV